MKWIQKCTVCDWQAEYESNNSDDEQLIRAACLPCGHQGLFTLEKMEEQK